MKILALFPTLLFLFFSGSAVAQPSQATLDPHKPTLDRLEALVTESLPDWRIHPDIPHPEDPSLSDADWQTISPNASYDDNAPNHWKGPRVLRRWVEIPAKIHGYSVRDARVRLDLNIGSDAAMVITVFSNGSIMFRGSQELEQPLLLAERAEPGQRFLISARIDAENVDTALFRARLLVEPPANRPDPSLFHDEVLAAEPMIAAYADGKAERQTVLDAAVNSINFSALERGDQAAFDQSLRDAQRKLEELNAWMKGFSIRAVGNSHIDMAWLWPWTETVQVVHDTFRSVLDLMREYPDFKFTMSSARTYEWMEEKYPDLFAEIRQRVKEGRCSTEDWRIPLEVSELKR